MAILLILAGCSGTEAAASAGLGAEIGAAVITVLALLWRLYFGRLAWARDVVAVANELVRTAVDLAVESSERGMAAARSDGVVTPEEWQAVRLEARRIFWENVSPWRLGIALRRVRERRGDSAPAPLLVPETWAAARIDHQLGTVLQAPAAAAPPAKDGP
jgi:hypothetical protein